MRDSCSLSRVLLGQKPRPSRIQRLKWVCVAGICPETLNACGDGVRPGQVRQLSVKQESAWSRLTMFRATEACQEFLGRRPGGSLFPTAAMLDTLSQLSPLASYVIRRKRASSELGPSGPRLQSLAVFDSVVSARERLATSVSFFLRDMLRQQSFLRQCMPVG